MLKTSKKIFTLVILILLISFKLNAIENKILLKVNNEIITSIDILNEIKYLNLINNELKNLDKFKIYEISKNSLIREKIKENELKNNFSKIEIEEEILEKVILNYFSRFNISSMKDFENLIEQNDLDFKSIIKKVTIDLMWNELIYQKYKNNIRIDEDSIRKQILNNDMQYEFLISEIVFDLKSKENLEKKYNLIKTTINEENFSNAVLIFSISDSVKNNGKLGWIKETSLSPKIKKQIKDTKLGEITKPIKIPGGFMILKIEDRRETKTNLNIDKEMKLVIKKQTNEQFNQFSNIYFKKIQKNIKINEL